MDELVIGDLTVSMVDEENEVTIEIDDNHWPWVILKHREMVALRDWLTKAIKQAEGSKQ